jgi:diacylglycerol O-acyltransferase
MSPSVTRPVDRLDSNDLPNLVAEKPGRAWNIAALLVLDRDPLIGSDGIVELKRFSDSIEARVATIPRLRQVLRRPRPGLGLPYWCDDPDFRITRHVEVIRLTTALDWDAVIRSTEGILERPLDLAHPLWQMYLIDGPSCDRVALVIILHHVLADGIGGLAVLAGLIDPGPTTRMVWNREPGPTRGALLADNLRRRAVGVRAVAPRLLHPVSLLEPIRSAYRDMWREPAAATSFNVPIGPRRDLRIANVPLHAVVDTAHAGGATVNDLALTAISGAMASLFKAGHERIPEKLQASIPVSLRRETNAKELGNRVSGMRIALPLAEIDDFDRLRLIAAATNIERAKHVDTSRTKLFQGFWRALTALRLHNWFVRHQRMVNIYVTNVAGPKVPVGLFDAPVQAIIPIPPLGGNIPIGFGVFSYAGVLTISMVVEPDLVPDADSLLTGLVSSLGRLTGAAITTNIAFSRHSAVVTQAHAGAT